MATDPRRAEAVTRARALFHEAETEWVVSYRYESPMMGEGAYFWTLSEALPSVEGGLELVDLESGCAFTRLGVRWQTWRARRRRHLRGRVNVKGEVPRG